MKTVIKITTCLLFSLPLSAHDLSSSICTQEGLNLDKEEMKACTDIAKEHNNAGPHKKHVYKERLSFSKMMGDMIDSGVLNIRTIPKTNEYPVNKDWYYLGMLSQQENKDPGSTKNFKGCRKIKENTVLCPEGKYKFIEPDASTAVHDSPNRKLKKSTGTIDTKAQQKSEMIP